MLKSVPNTLAPITQKMGRVAGLFSQKSPRKTLFIATTRYFYRFQKKVSFKAILERFWGMMLSHFGVDFGPFSHSGCFSADNL
jgi:hypothetical protein